MRRATFIACLVLVLLAPASAGADVLVLESGARLEGEIVDESPAEVTIRTGFGGIVVVSRDRILEIERDFDPRAELERRIQGIREDDARAWYELALWCRDQGLPAEATDFFERVVELDPNHEGARRALGYVFHEGEWYPREEYNEEVLGLVYVDGRWLTPAEKAMIDRGFTRNDEGEWVPASEEPEPSPRPRRQEPADPEPTSVPEPEPEPEPESDGGRRLPPPPPADDSSGADTAWYDDHEGVPWSEAREYETPNYVIETNVKPEYVERYGEMLELYHVRFRRVFQNFLPSGGLPRSHVKIYKSQDEFMQQEGQGPGVGGYYTTRGRMVVAYHGQFGQNGNTRTVLAHEGTHQFEDLIIPFRNAPIWLLEGFAVFFESAYYDGETVQIGTIPRDRLQVLKRGIAADDYIPLSELIRTPQARFTAFHYAHAWSLIYMMVYYNRNPRYRRNNQEVFSGLFRLAQSQRVTPEDVEALFGGREAFEEFEEVWKEWVLDLPYDFDPDEVVEEEDE